MYESASSIYMRIAFDLETVGFPVEESAREKTDLNAIQQGHTTLTPLEVGRTRVDHLQEMKTWNFEL